jgi:hypothetical protein
MASTITQRGTTITPLLVTGYDTSRDSANIVHWIIGREDPDVTLRRAKLRRGTLNMLFATEAQAASCENVHTDPEVFVFADTDLPSIGMRYVVNGPITRGLDPETRELWLVTVAYQEIAS